MIIEHSTLANHCRITIPDNVTSIGAQTFAGSGLTVAIMNPVVKDNLSLQFGDNQSFYGKTGVTIANRETYVPGPDPLLHLNQQLLLYI